MIKQLARGDTRNAGNRLDPVMTDVPDIANVVVGTPLETSDDCFVSCVLCVEQSVPDYNVRSTVFLSIVPFGTVSAVQSGALHGVTF